MYFIGIYQVYWNLSKVYDHIGIGLFLSIEYEAGWQLAYLDHFLRKSQPASFNPIKSFAENYAKLNKSYY